MLMFLIHSVTVGPIANLKGPYFQPSLSVCVSLTCTYPSALTDFDETWSQGPYSDLVWPMVQIGRKGTARRLFENFKKFAKITEFEFQNSGPSFFASVSPVYCKKKIRLDSNTTGGGNRF